VAQDQLKKNPSALGDPISMKAETSDKAPTPTEEGAKSDSNSNSKSKLKAEINDKAPTPTEGGAKPKSKL